MAQEPSRFLFATPPRDAMVVCYEGIEQFTMIGYNLASEKLSPYG